MDDMSTYYQAPSSSAHHHYPPSSLSPVQSQPPPPVLHHYTPQLSAQHEPYYPYYPSPTPPLEPPSAPTIPPQPYVPIPYHHHHHHPPTPPPYSTHEAPVRYGAESAFEEVRTLFVAGLPEDVNPREIYNLFREFPGYESSHLRTQNRFSLPFAFVVFLDQRCAIGAMQAVNGMVFDLEKGSTLHIDLAKSNSRSKRSRTDDERDVFDKRVKGALEYPRGFPILSHRGHFILNAHLAHVLHAWALAGLGSVHMPGMTNSAYNMIDYSSSQSYPNYGGRAVNDANQSKPNVPPCPTLFVANLGPSCTEEELIQTFSRCPGFLKLKMQNTYGSPVAFVDFQCTNMLSRDTPSSTGARNHLQGTILYSSPPGEGIRLDYAKTRMGLRRRPK